MLELIAVVTVSAPDLRLTASAYEEYLQYRIVADGTVSEELADTWATPKMAGRDYLLLQPASQAEVYLRLVQTDAAESFGAMKSFGWNANEILTQDPDAMAERLADSPFDVVGSPKNLSTNENIRAMQAIGPAKEVIYLTRLPEGFRLGSARSFVDRTFIVVLGGPDMEAMRSFYSEVLGLEVSDPVGARIRLLSRAHGLDLEHRHPLAMASLPSQFGVELDEYPQTATTRAQRDGELPPGIAMVSFTTRSLEPFAERLLAAPRALETQPYSGSRAGVIQGPAGELIELIERE